MQIPEGLQNGHLELLTSDGNLAQAPTEEVKAICFVKDFDATDQWRLNRTFASRPKTSGLWLRLQFRDGDTLEGILPNNLMLIETEGFSIIPPDPTFQNQRIFVPRPALAGVEVLGVIGSPLRRRPKPKKTDDENQLQMFE